MMTLLSSQWRQIPLHCVGMVMTDGPQAVEVIVVLGCRVTGRAVFGAALRRASRAAVAWRESGEPWLIASGGRRWAGVAEADALRDELVRQGVRSERVLRELCSLSTRENAWYSRMLVESLGGKRVALVTCDFHMPRALACFRAVGLDPIPFAVQSPERPWARRLKLRLREKASVWLEGATGTFDSSRFVR